MAVDKPEPGSDSLAQYEALGSHFIAQDIAITCMLEAISKSQPAHAAAIMESLKLGVKNIPDGKLPAAKEKIAQWVAMMEGVLSSKPQ